MLGIRTVSLDRLVGRKLLTPCRALRKPLFTEAELLRFLEGTKEKMAPPKKKERRGLGTRRRLWRVSSREDRRCECRLQVSLRLLLSRSHEP